MDYIIWDQRLEGSRPRRYMTLAVNEDTKLTDAVSYAVMRAGFNGGKLDRLFLMAHGIEDNGHGGYGMQFCAEDLTQLTVHMLGPLNKKVNKIILLSCSVAALANESAKGGEGDGELLCRRMAKITGAWVRASTYQQEYYSSSVGIDFGDWEGDCWWFSPDGKTKLRADLKTY
jgi:hypothetical protein